MATRRQERIAELIREEVSKIILFELNDPRMGLCTVTRTDISPDLRQSRVFLSVLGEDAEVRTTLRALDDARGHIQSKLATALEMRRTPEISFQLDRELKKVQRLHDLLGQIAVEREEDEKDDVEDEDHE